MESNKLARSPTSHTGLFEVDFYTDCFDSAPSQVQDADGAQDLQLSAGRVEFDGVCFSYAPGCVDVVTFTFTHSRSEVGTLRLE